MLGKLFNALQQKINMLSRRISHISGILKSWIMY